MSLHHHILPRSKVVYQKQSSRSRWQSITLDGSDHDDQLPSPPSTPEPSEPSEPSEPAEPSHRRIPSPSAHRTSSASIPQLKNQRPAKQSKRNRTTSHTRLPASSSISQPINNETNVPSKRKKSTQSVSQTNRSLSDRLPHRSELDQPQTNRLSIELPAIPRSKNTLSLPSKQSLTLHNSRPSKSRSSANASEVEPTHTQPQPSHQTIETGLDPTRSSNPSLKSSHHQTHIELSPQLAPTRRSSRVTKPQNRSTQPTLTQQKSHSTSQSQSNKEQSQTPSEIISSQSPGSYQPIPHNQPDAFVILDSHLLRHEQDQTDSERPSKKVRVAPMGRKTTLPSSALSQSVSSDHPRPDNHTDRPRNSLAGRALSGQSSSGLFGRSSITQTSDTGTSRQPLDKQPSADLTAIPVNTANLVNLFQGGNVVKKTYGGERTFKNDDNELKLLLPPSTPGSQAASNGTPVSKSFRLSSSSKRFKTRETYSELRKRWGVDVDDESIMGQATVVLQTISHQRASGSSKRFTDGLSYLIEGLVTSPEQQSQSADLSLKRSSAVELIRKFKDPKFLENLRSNGLIERLYDSLRSATAGDGDPILDHSLLIFISIMCCEDQKFIEPVLRILPKHSKPGAFSMQSDCLQVLGQIINRTNSQASSSSSSSSSPPPKVLRLSRRQPQLISRIEEVVQESALRKHFSGPSSPSLLALLSLSRISIFVPRPGLLPQQLIVQSSAFASVLDCLEAHSIALQNRFDHLVPNQAFSAGDGEEILKHIGYCMDVIESCAVCEEDALKAIDLLRPSLVGVFASLISLCHVLARHDESKISTSALDILIGCLRTMVNMTNYNPLWSYELSTRPVLEALCGLFSICREGYDEYYSQPSEEDEHQASKRSIRRTTKHSHGLFLSSIEQNEEPFLQSSNANRIDEVVFDLLCVDLGLLANLLEESSKAKDMLKELQIDHSTACFAPHAQSNSTSNHLMYDDSTNGIEELIKLYVNPPCAKVDEKKFIRSSISVLINLILLSRNSVDESLPINEEGDNNIDALHGNENNHPSINETEIIKGFKRIFSQNQCSYYRSKQPENTHEDGSFRQASKRKNGSDYNDMIKPSESNQDDIEIVKLETQNLLVKEFFQDLKLNSSSILNFHQVGPNEDPKVVQTLESSPSRPTNLRSTRTTTTINSNITFPSVLTQPNLTLTSNLNHRQNLERLESSWNRLWAELI